jgi:hypothetical protein
VERWPHTQQLLEFDPIEPEFDCKLSLEVFLLHPYPFGASISSMGEVADFNLQTETRSLFEDDVSVHNSKLETKPIPSPPPPLPSSTLFLVLRTPLSILLVLEEGLNKLRKIEILICTESAKSYERKKKI